MLTEKYLSVQSRARDFALRVLAPIRQTTDETGAYPDWVYPEVVRAGYAAMVHPVEYGGGGQDYLSLCLTCEEFCRVDPGAAGMLVNNTLSGSPLRLFATDAQKEKYLRPLCEGKLRAAFALTEPDAGCDTSAIKTTAVEDGAFYVLNGQKRYIIMAPYADVFTVFAKTDPTAGNHGLTAFLVEANTPGFTVGPPVPKMGLAGNQISELFFENAHIPKSNMLGEVNRGIYVALGTLDTGRITVASQCLGIAQGCLDLAVEYAKTRVQFGKPLSKFQNTQFKLAEIAVKVEAARQLVYAAAEKLDKTGVAGTEAAIAKYYASETANEAAYRALQVFGGEGYMKGSPIEQFYRDARILPIYDGTSEVMLMVISKQLFQS